MVPWGCGLLWNCAGQLEVQLLCVTPNHVFDIPFPRNEARQSSAGCELVNTDSIRQPTTVNLVSPLQHYRSPVRLANEIAGRLASEVCLVLRAHPMDVAATFGLVSAVGSEPEFTL